MPPKGYKHLSVKEEVYRRLEELARSKGLSSVSDAVVLLLEYSDIYSKLEYILQRGVSNLPQTGVSQKYVLPDTSTHEGATESKSVERGGSKEELISASYLEEYVKHDLVPKLKKYVYSGSRTKLVWDLSEFKKLIESITNLPVNDVMEALVDTELIEILGNQVVVKLK